MPAGHHAGSRGRTIEVRCVKAIQPQAGFGQRVEVGRLEIGMAVVARVTLTLIIRHDEDDVGSRGRVATRDRLRETTRDHLHKDH